MKIKRIITGALAAVMVLSAAACSSTDNAPDASSVTASATTEKYVSLFEERVETMPQSLVILSGDEAAEYGIDVDGFVDSEGFIARADNGNVVIAGANDAGVDRGVRHFTNYGNYDSYNYTYGEGYRVNGLTVMGTPIEDFTVVIPDDADKAMKYGASELVKYIKNATGIELPTAVASANTDDHVIEFIIDESHGDEAFSIDVKADGNITILCGQYRGAIYGAHGLLEDMGWRFLADGTDYVYESEGLDLTEDIDRTETAAINVRMAASFTANYDMSCASRVHMHSGDTKKSIVEKYGLQGLVFHACHGLQNSYIDWEDLYKFDALGGQPCYTDEEILQIIEDYYRNYIETQMNAGKKVYFIDVAQFDSPYFCMCESCLEVYIEDGCDTGAVLRMTNRMADMAAEYDPDIYATMLAYSGTNKVPKVTRPSDNVKIAYCFYFCEDLNMPCTNHSITDEDCPTNAGFYEQFEGWKAICKPENLQVWYYPLNYIDLAFPTPALDTAYADVKYFIESGIDCLVLCDGENIDSILLTAHAELMWNGDMTEEDYRDFVEECFRIYYGDSAEYIMEYTDIVLQAGNATGCWSSFNDRTFDRLDTDFFAQRFDYMVYLFDRAMMAAETEEIAQRVEKVRGMMLYAGVSVVHEDRYVNGTDEERAEINRLHTELHDIFVKYNMVTVRDYQGRVLYAPDKVDYTKAPYDYWY